MDTLNYSTQAIDDLQIQAKDFSIDMPIAAGNILRIADLLKRAVKFHLPDNGDLFEDEYRALPAIFRLPYPIIAAEFRIVRNASLDHQPLAKHEDLDVSSKRIALAVEINADNFDAFSWMLPPEKFNLLTLDGAIAVISVFYLDEKKQWTIPPLGIVIPARKIEPNSELLAQSKKIYGDFSSKGMKQVPLEMHPTYLMPEYIRQLEKAKGIDYVMSTAAQDNQDENNAVLGLIEILSCKNVATDTIEAPIALNKKREAKGKVPFFEYKVLMLNFQNDSKSTENRGGTHASPRIHLRRGHIRRLPEKNVWVNASIVGNRKAGIIVKNYSIKWSTEN